MTISRPGGDGDLGVEAGSRLRPVVAIAGGGAAAFLGWHDSLLELDCSFRPMADGSLRCIPGGPRVVFTDPDCTQAAWVETPCFSDFRYAGLQSLPGDPCASGVEAHPTMYRRIAGSLAADEIYGAMLTPDGLDCGATPLPLAQGEVLVPAEPVPLDTFVAAEDQVVAGDGRLGRIERRAEDGAFEVTTPHDAGYDRSCLPAPWFGDGQRCVVQATSAVDDGRFPDETCTGATTRPQCGAVIARRGHSCSTPQVYEIAEALDTVYARGDGSCESETSNQAHRVGRRLFADDFPVLHRHEEGTGRLRARYSSDATGWRVTPNEPRLLDTELGVVCEVSPAAGRCLPVAGNFVAERFADPSCSEPVFVTRADSCQLADWLRDSERDDDGCAQIAAHRRVLYPDPSLVTYATVDGSCVPSPLDEGDVAFRLGPPQLPDSMADVRVEIR